ncbi:MAG: class I tRNA ligase family protein, partial [Candidatus Omnitrophica bacterium]|nr:class I tRNA ligase family protein [Candidatus Omnitrophota bacterium]
YKMENVRGNVENAYGVGLNPLFEFHRAYKGIYDFCNEELSMYYLDMVKGRLYTARFDSMERRAAQTTIYEVLNCLIRLMAPILVFTAEEIWRNMPKKKNDADCLSVHLLDFPGANPTFRQDDFESRGLKNVDQELSELIGLVPLAAKALEELRSEGKIGSSFDAQINILTKTQDRYTFLQSFNIELCEIFKVSQVKVAFDKESPADLSVKVEKAEGAKCPRCWNYSLKVGSNPAHPLICDNCLKAIGER